MDTAQTVLLTGASGVVGSALLPELTSQNFNVLALMRRSPLSVDGIETIVGDVTSPNFGLDLQALTDEHGPISCVIHSAAITNFDASDEEIHKTNVEGTLNAIAVADALGARLIYVSTAFTHDLALPPYMKEYSSYCQSKRRAESHIKESAVDYTIVRPSIVIGDSATGEIAYFQGLHNVVAALLLGIAPMLPTVPSAMIDMVPQDVLSRAIAALARRGGKHREYWITRGSSASRIESAYPLLEKFLQTYKQDACLPKMVDPEVIERLFKPVFLPSLPRRLRKKLSSLVDYACYFNLHSPFPCNYDDLVEEFDLAPMPSQESVLWNNLTYWAEQTRFRDKVVYRDKVA